MPDDWGDDFDGDWDLDGHEMVLDDELEFDEFGLDDEVDPEPEAEDWDEPGGFGALGIDDDAELDELDSMAVGESWSTGGGGAGVSAPSGGVAGGGGAGERMSWSAWDVGVAFAMVGWMLDQHAEQIGREIRSALAASSLPAADAGPRGAPHPPPPSGIAYRSGAEQHRVGDPLSISWLYSELAAASTHGRDLLLQAGGEGPGGGRLVLVVSVVPGSAGPSLWVVAEQHPGGFAASRLVPVFQADASGGFAVFATDHASEAADAVAWACGREGISSASLRVDRHS
jgi:hypothetical protein